MPINNNNDNPYKLLTDEEMTAFLEAPDNINRLTSLAHDKIITMGKEANQAGKQVGPGELTDALYTLLGNEIQVLLPNASFESVSAIASYLTANFIQEIKKAVVAMGLRKDAVRKTIQEKQ